MTDKKLVLTTAASAEEARRIAHALVERRLAACVNIVAPVESIYRWEGTVQDAQERLLVIKTTAEAFSEVRAAIASLHSYQLPECIALTVDDGSPDYLDWIAASVSA